jgi:SAM-dependent methyltransferase
LGAGSGSIDVAPSVPYYGRDLARIHHEGFAFHAEAVAQGILALLEPVRERGGLILEIGCGSGRLTKHLVEGGHRVLATDASPAMVDRARDYVPRAEAIKELRQMVVSGGFTGPVVLLGISLSSKDESAFFRGLIQSGKVLEVCPPGFWRPWPAR